MYNLLFQQFQSLHVYMLRPQKIGTIEKEVYRIAEDAEGQYACSVRLVPLKIVYSVNYYLLGSWFRKPWTQVCSCMIRDVSLANIWDMSICPCGWLLRAVALLLGMCEDWWDAWYDFPLRYLICDAFQSQWSSSFGLKPSPAGAPHLRLSSQSESEVNHVSLS